MTMDAIFTSNRKELESILHKSILQAEVLQNNGLYKGKLGVSILFYYYARYSSKPLYEQFADELIDDIITNISINDVVGFGYGLSGIGWGIQHLLEQKFVEGDANDILSELDFYIMQRDPRRMIDLSFDSGLSGINHYMETRLQYAKINQLCMPFDETYLKDMECAKQKQQLVYCNTSEVLMQIWLNLKPVSIK